jgi:hypothetical protein
VSIRGYRWTADWSRHGVLTETLEDLTTDGLRLIPADTPIVVTWGRSEARSTADSATGKLTGTLDNYGRQFSSVNQSSPIAGKVLPGTPVKFTVDVAGATTVLFAGPMDVPRVDPTGKTLSVECSDGLGRPGQDQLSTPVYSGKRTGDLLNVLLDAIGWTGGRAIDPGATVVPWWWVEGQDFQAAADDLARSEGPPAVWFVQGGTFYFHDRHHRLVNADSTTSQATWTHLLTPVATTNQLTNSTFESGVASWTAFNGATRAQSSTVARTGSFSMRITPDGTTSGPYVESEQHACPAGFEWTASAWWFNGVAWPTGVSVNLEWYDAGHSYITVTQGTVVALVAGAWTQTTVRAWPVSAAAYVSMNVFITGTPGATVLFYVDDASLAPTADVKILRDSFGYDDGLDNIVNAASIEVTPRVPGDLSVVWSITDPIALGPSESRTLVVRADDPFVNAIVPDSTTTYPVDGDYSTDFHLLSGAVTVTISRTSGQSLDLTLTGDPSLGAFLDTGISLRAVPLTAGATYKFADEDPSSVNLYGRNAWDGTAPWAYLYDADVISQQMASLYAQPRPSVTMSIAGYDSVHMAEIAARTVGDRITVREDEMGLNADFTVEQVQHTVLDLLNSLHQMQVGCQVVAPVQPANVFTFDVAGKGFDQGAFGVLGVSNAAKMFTFDQAGKGFDDGLFAA